MASVGMQTHPATVVSVSPTSSAQRSARAAVVDAAAAVHTVSGGCDGEAQTWLSTTSGSGNHGD